MQTNERLGVKDTDIDEPEPRFCDDGHHRQHTPTPPTLSRTPTIWSNKKNNNKNSREKERYRKMRNVDRTKTFSIRNGHMKWH